MYIRKGGPGAAHSWEDGETVAQAGKYAALDGALLADKLVDPVHAGGAAAPNHGARAAIDKQKEGEQGWAHCAHCLDHRGARDGGVRSSPIPRAHYALERLVVGVCEPGSYGGGDRLHSARDTEAVLASRGEKRREGGLLAVEGGPADESEQRRAHADGSQVRVALRVDLRGGAVRLHLDKGGEGAVQQPRVAEAGGELAAQRGVSQEGDGLHDEGGFAAGGEGGEVLLREEVEPGRNSGSEEMTRGCNLRLGELEGR